MLARNPESSPAGSGDTLITRFFQQFEDRAGSSEGLNYFFNDELHVGAGKFAWNQDFAQEFKDRKGYDLFRFLPAMWIDVGNITPKVRMDYADVRIALMEERYFIPIYKCTRAGNDIRMRFESKS